MSDVSIGLENITMNLGLRATGRETKVLKFIYQHKDDEVRYYDIAENICFGDESSNIGLDIVLEDLVKTKLLSEKHYGTQCFYIISDKGYKLINKLRFWDKQ